jgi:ectoine hydroxylase-related dioxygenase (phytanoyl-CoA dioxygenase family)
MNSLIRYGFQMHPGVFAEDEIHLLREEADRVAADAGSACVRRLCERSDMFRDLARSSEIRSLLPHPDLQPVRSILFDKTPSENWPVAWHQDLTICTQAETPCDGYGPWSCKDGVPHVQPPLALLASMVTVRIHLDPTGGENGALRVIPSSHLHGRLNQESIAALTAGGAHTCECQPGDVLLMSPLILHSSKRSSRPDRRRILHFEYAPTDALAPRLTWHESSAEATTSLQRFP